MRVSSTSRSRIEDISRPISASVSSVSTYCRSALNSLAFSMATATWAANCRSSASSWLVNASVVSLSRLSAPMTLPFRRIGTASCDSMLRRGRDSGVPGECR